MSDNQKASALSEEVEKRLMARIGARSFYYEDNDTKSDPEWVILKSDAIAEVTTAYALGRAAGMEEAAKIAEAHGKASLDLALTYPASPRTARNSYTAGIQITAAIRAAKEGK